MKYTYHYNTVAITTTRLILRILDTEGAALIYNNLLNLILGTVILLRSS